MDTTKIRNKVKKLINSQTHIIHENQTFRKYVEKCQKQNINNEEKIVQPFTLLFLKLLNYVNQHNLVIEEVKNGNKPDFYADEFILECKSTKYDDFGKKDGRIESPKEQLERYLVSQEFSRPYGILFSLERFEVYTIKNGSIIYVRDLSFSLMDFYESKPSNIDNFIAKFYVSPLSLEEKIDIIAKTERTDLLPIRPEPFNKLLKSIIKEIDIELNSQFLHLNPSDDETILIKNKICQIKKQMDLRSTEEATVEYLSQTSYIILARILLTKCWEDLELIDPPNMYNGGFRKYIQEYNEEISEVYQRALNKSQNIYFLFNPSNPYLMMDLDENLIVDILFQICKYDFQSLDYDILGYIYEDYLDLEHRKKFGQYYTPPYVVNLILDRVGFKATPNELLDQSILDPASGSGTFLLSAVQRIISSWKDGSDHSIKYKESIEQNLFGSELMLFPYLISEINILIQISPILKKLLEKEEKLNVLHIFPNNSFNLADKLLVKEYIKDIPEDTIKGNNIVDSAVMDRKKNKLEELQKKSDFDFVVGNPPYVANDTNPELFREMREYFTFCEETYHNKMDLFYWFIILGILKLKPGGKLAFITTRYWIDKGEKTGVETLKKYILDLCYVREIIDLRNVNVFVSATGQENVIFILEKKGPKIKDDLISIFKLNTRPEKNECVLSDCLFERGYCKNDQEYLKCICSHEDKWDSLFSKDIPLTQHIKAFKSARMTGDLAHNRSWDIFLPSEGIIKDIMDSIIENCTNDVEKIDQFETPYVEKDVIKYINNYFLIRVGVLTTMDEAFIITPKFYKEEGESIYLKMKDTIDIRRSEKQDLIEEHEGYIDNEGFVWLKVSESGKKRLMNHYKTPSVYRHGLDISKFVGKLIFFEDEEQYDDCPILVYYLHQYYDEIIEKLEGYNELTDTRPNKWITLRRSGKIRLPNNDTRNLFEYYQSKPKIFYNYRVGNNNVFGFSDNHMVAATDMYFFHPYGEKINIYYILAYLNSKIITFYFKERPIELQRQKTNVENDIPIFLPRTDPERELANFIIRKEKQLVKMLQKLEKRYRLKGFHFDLKKEGENDINVDIQAFLKNVDLWTIDKLSYKASKKSEIKDVNRKDFPILIYNSRGKEDVDDFDEIIKEDGEVIFKSSSLKIFVPPRYYEPFKIALDSYLQFSEKSNLTEVRNLKLPNQRALEIINLKKENLKDKISILTSEEKIVIDNFISDVLNGNETDNSGEIDSISKILYFIDLSFANLMTPEFIDEVMDY